MKAVIVNKDDEIKVGDWFQLDYMIKTVKEVLGDNMYRVKDGQGNSSHNYDIVSRDYLNGFCVKRLSNKC